MILLEDVEYKLIIFKKICGELDKICEMLVLWICIGMNGYLNYLDVVRIKLLIEFLEIWFIINIELEDVLIFIDFIKIEVINIR